MRRLSGVGLAVLLAAAPCAPARAAGVSLHLNVGHGLPGDGVHVTATVTDCDASAVTLSLRGRSADGDESGSAGGDVSATQPQAGTWEADLPVSAHLAAPQSLQVVATVTCPSGTATASSAFHVDAFDTQRLTVSPADAAAGQRISFAMTGGRGSCWSAWVTDGDGTDWSVFHDGPYSGKTLTAELDAGSDMTSRVSGSFVVPAAMALGAVVLTVHCSQSADRPVRFDVVPGAASADPVAATPTPTDRRTPSRVALGGGEPVLDAPTPYESPYPLPTLAPPLEATTAPQAVSGASVDTGGSSTPVWWVLLGLVGLAVPWGLLRVRRRDL